MTTLINVFMSKLKLQPLLYYCKYTLSISQSVDKWFSQSINHLINQSVSQSINQLLLNRLINCSVSIILAHLTRHKHFTGLLYPWRETLFEIKPISLKISRQPHNALRWLPIVLQPSVRWGRQLKQPACPQRIKCPCFFIILWP